MTLHFACQAFITADDILDGKCGCELDETDDAELIADCIDQASDMLSVISSGMAAGVCTVTVRPVRLCSDGPAAFDTTRRFGGIVTVPLRGPETRVVSVIVDGVVLNPSEYGLLDDRYLFRKVGCWPTSNNLRLDDTNVGTWSITYAFGFVDKLTRMAATELACELIKDGLGKPNALPRGVTSISVQGASASVRNRAEALRDGDEQIPVLARWMSQYAYDGPHTVSGIYSPELDQGWELVEVEGASGS